MLTRDEKAGFSERLRQVLQRANNRVLSAAELATQFNLRHPNEPITPQAAQKWLSGKARPTPDKIRTLAIWLDAPFHWLSYGAPEPCAARRNDGAQGADTAGELSPQEWRLIEGVRRLTVQQQNLVYGITEAFALERGLLPKEKQD